MRFDFSMFLARFTPQNNAQTSERLTEYARINDAASNNIQSSGNEASSLENIESKTPNSESNAQKLYIVTPTFARPERLADMTR